MINLIRHRFAWLLLLAALALVANPVWHATGHIFSDHAPEHLGHVSDTHWGKEDFCPYCDAVSQIAELPTFKTPYLQLVRVGDIVSIEGYRANLSLFLSSRLRAPPFLA